MNDKGANEPNEVHTFTRTALQPRTETNLGMVYQTLKEVKTVLAKNLILKMSILKPWLPLSCFFFFVNCTMRLRSYADLSFRIIWDRAY